MAYTSNYLSNESRYREQMSSQRANYLRIEMRAFDSEDREDKELIISLYAFAGEGEQEEFFSGSLSKLIELTLLGKTYKEQLQAEAKKGEAKDA